MAKKKTVKRKKPAKKTAGKKVAKKKKVVKKKNQKPKGPDPRRGLHAKKAEIMAKVPNMPCSAIGRDLHGLRFAHTQAERVYAVYRDLCAEKGLVIHRTEGKSRVINDTAERIQILFEGVWEIRDRATGQTETFGGHGQGDNGRWSANSAQTIAKKQALLDYFETAWPQPTQFLEVIRDSIAAVPDAEKVEAFKQILPPQAWDVLTAAGAVKELKDFFERKGKVENANSTRKNRRRKSKS